MTDAPRCEPADPSCDGWHWVAWRGNPPKPYRWHVSFHGAGVQIAVWSGLEFSMENTPERAYAAGYRYDSPVHSPDAVAALVRAGRAVLDVMLTAEKPSEALTIGHAADLHEALKPFTEAPDAE